MALQGCQQAGTTGITDIMDTMADSEVDMGIMAVADLEEVGLCLEIILLNDSAC